MTFRYFFETLNITTDLSIEEIHKEDPPEKNIEIQLALFRQ